MSNNTGSAQRFIILLLAGAVVALTVLLLRQRAETSRLRAEAAPPPPPVVSTGSADGSTGMESRPVAPSPAEADPAISSTEEAGPQVEPAPESPPLVMTPTGMQPSPSWTGLSLAGTHVAPIEGGLRATMQFNPTTQDPLGIVAVVVRLPRDSEARILSLDAAEGASYANVAHRVSEDGKFAIFQGTVNEARSLTFSLGVSGETVADVRGTAGIGPFDLRIVPGSATVTPKK